MTRWCMTAQALLGQPWPQPDLPRFDPGKKACDDLHRWYANQYGRDCWEMVAMSLVALRDRAEIKVCSYLDDEAWQHAPRFEAGRTWAALRSDAVSQICPGPGWRSPGSQPKCSVAL